MLTALVATLALAATQAVDPPAPVELRDGWSLYVGDLPSADAAERVPAGRWRPVAVPADFETVAPGHDGFVWYRRAVRVPDGLAGEPLGIRVEMVGDAFEAYWNGVPLGGSGGFPPRFVESGDGIVLSVPVRALERRPDGVHLLTVRVYNEYAYGGLMGPVRVGHMNALASIRRPTDMVAGAMAAFFLAIALFHGILYLRRPSAPENLWFAVLCAAAAAYALTFLPSYNPAGSEYVNQFRLRVVSFYVAAGAFTAFAWRMFGLRPGWMGRVALAGLLVMAAVATQLPLATLANTYVVTDAVALAAAAVLAARILHRAPREPWHGRLLAAGIVVFLLTVAWDTGGEHGWASLPLAHLLPAISGAMWVGLFALVVAMEAAVASRFADAEADARTDRLTGLSRRHVFDLSLEREAERVRRAGGSVAVLMIDLDHFKHVNDEHGHATGDEVLRQVGRLLRDVTRGADLAARVGGEEFAVLLTDADGAGAAAYLERFRAALGRLAIPAPGGAAVRVTASVGVAVGDATVVGAELHEAADRALYLAKRAGRDRVVVSDPAAAPDPRLDGLPLLRSDAIRIAGGS